MNDKNTTVPKNALSGLSNSISALRKMPILYDAERSMIIVATVAVWEFKVVTRAFLRRSRLIRQDVTRPKAPIKENVKSFAGQEPTFLQKIGKPGISKQIIFVTATSFAAFILAAAQTTIETEYWTERMKALSPVWSVKSISNTDLKRAQNSELIQGLREKLASIQTTVQQLPVLIRPWINLAFVSVMQPYADASEGKRLCWKICLFNFAIYAAWKVKRWEPFMSRSFMHYPLSGKSYTLLTSTFSHKGALHLLFNCLALESFAGLFSGLVSHIVNAKFRYPRLIAQLASSVSRTRRTETWAGAVAATTATAAETTAKKKVLDILPSLGASGAIYAAVTMTALAFPDSQVALFIPPTYPINIQYGVGGLVLMDMIGIMRGWRVFDHWAHLGGAAFGVFYYKYGPQWWRYLRETADSAE
ncbi:hypothetical protein CVT26_006204 [Gymnopilus dilepis]|uniref:Peptidase S54 rhomboid domain-containing protein n=1 Tax=Gymnopilus dilepis TaxID=231916 RepID=A0A409Y1E4_9AGAR|nr:hypothetical protein CVT26_006204 [Gymnopilus dilepis]